MAMTIINIEDESASDVFEYITPFRTTMDHQNLCNAERIHDLYGIEKIILMYLSRNHSSSSSFELKDRYIHIREFLRYTKVIFSDDKASQQQLIFDILSYSNDKICFLGNEYDRDQFMELKIPQYTILETFKKDQGYTRLTNESNNIFTNVCIIRFFIFVCAVAFLIRSIPFFLEGDYLIGIAKGAGLCTIVLTIIAFFTVNKPVVLMIQKVSPFLYDLLHLEYKIKIHLICGMFLILFTAIHISAHYARSVSFSPVIFISGDRKSVV